MTNANLLFSRKSQIMESFPGTLILPASFTMEEGTLRRYRKKSFYWYKRVVASNGEDLS